MARIVALVDWNASGHHPLYFKHLALSLSQAHTEVVPFCPSPIEFDSKIDHSFQLSSNLGNVHPAQTVSYPFSSTFRPARLRRHYDTFTWFKYLGSILRAWEREAHRHIDIVFFACIYDVQFEYFRLAEHVFAYPWCGLYLHARSFRMPGSVIPHTNRLPSPHKFFSSPLLRGIAVLDEKAITPLQTIAAGKPVVAFPDFTDETLPNQSLELGLISKVQTIANGRPIISLLGHLHWTKGLDLFTHAASSPLMRDCLFVLAGEVSWDGFSADTKAELIQVWEQAPNIFTHLQRISTEPVLNSLVNGSDIILATYRSFPNSSNILTKAAVFKKPVVVSDGYLMAERVRDYRLGEVVPEGDVNSLIDALRRMLEPSYKSWLHSTARWDDYKRYHSVERLTQVMHQFISDI